MARHASNAQRRVPLAPVASVLPTGRSAFAGVGVAAAGLGLAVLTGAGIAAAGVTLAPRAPTAAAPAPNAAPSIDTVSLASSPAQAAVAAVLTTPIGTGWTPAGALTWTAGTPFDQPCGRPTTTDAAVAASRAFTFSKSQVMVTVAAYAAGHGAVALDGWSTLLTDCAGTTGRVGRYSVATPGTAGLVAWLRRGPDAAVPAAMLLWRRGDVLVSVTVASERPGGLAALGAEVDTAVLAVLAGRCADIDSTLADAARSPYVDRAAFLGRTVPITIAVPPSAPPVPPPGVAPLPGAYSPGPLPSVSYPARPLEPVWPLDLPVPVASPFAPVAPLPQPGATTVPSRVADPVGPGCGWVFTGQVAPPFDQAASALDAEARAQQAQAELVAQQTRWQAETVSYWSEVPVYEEQAALFVAYADSVRAVASAWDTITAQRTEYATALAAYQLAETARSDFLVRQDAARLAYEAAVTACGSPAPTDLPSPPTPPDPTATPAPTQLPTAAPDAPPIFGCPPAVPAILYESPPQVPEVPTPPPAPQPPS